MKITKYLLSMAAALGMFAGCYKPEMVQVSAPEDVIAPVLEAIDGPIDITAENMASGVVEFKWSLADYGVLTQVDYSIEVATAAAPAAVPIPKFFPAARFAGCIPPPAVRGFLQWKPAGNAGA